MANVYEELAKKLGVEQSRLIPLIWKVVCSEEEARIINATPATAAELAGRFGLDLQDMEERLAELFYRGLIFEQKKEGKTIYRMPRHIVQFHDASVLWPEAPPVLLDLWARYMEEEYPQIPALLTEAKATPFLRVIPVAETISPQSQVVLYQDAARIVEEATAISVTNCPCRLIARKCDKPLEVCLQLNRGADYMVKRGIGRKIDAEAAKEILKKAASAGLVHLVENREGIGNVICNCCNCCCIGLSYVNNPATRGVIQDSGYRVSLKDEECTSCGECEDICPAQAISLAGGSLPSFAGEKCLGCGLCASVCPAGALYLLPKNQVTDAGDGR